MEKDKATQGTLRAKASTKDVLGSGNSAPERIEPKWREYYDQLVTMRSRLLSRREELVRDASEEQPVFSLHMADAGTDNFDRDFALSMASSEQSAVYEIEQALGRIRSGSYGVCELTGKPIETDRLKAVPWARFSTEAEKQLEKEGVVHRPRLAPLEGMPKTNETAETDEVEVEEEA
jgi:RNA polymerase-binding transcription factor DksA